MSKDSVKYPTDFNWHTCHYAIDRLVVDDEYEWIEGRWYFWKDCYGNIEKARMKMDMLNDHFYPRPKTINENNVIAFKEIKGNPFFQNSII